MAPGSVSRCPPVDPAEMDDEGEAAPVEVVQAENVVATRTGMSRVRFTILFNDPSVAELRLHTLPTWIN